MNVCLRYQVSDQVIRRELIESGNPGKRDRTVAIALTALSAEAREAIADLVGVEDGFSALISPSGRPVKQISIKLLTYRPETLLYRGYAGKVTVRL